jgi:CDP-diacylglycerol--serine O-phosphatidyltransferase
MLHYILKPANLFTSASLFCGLYSVMASAGAEPGDSRAFLQAALLIIFAGIFDGLDGRVARLTHTESEFGVQLDSLVDVVSFGVAPGVLLYKWGLEAYGQVGLAVAFLFTACGAFRLARFNIHTERGREEGSRKYSEGLTITSAGCMVAALVLHHSKILATEVTNHLSILLLTLVLAYLMISTIRFRTFKEFRLSPASIAGLGAAVAIITFVLVAYDITMLLVVIGGSYITSGLLEEMFIFARRRKADDHLYLDAAPPEADDDEDPAAAGRHST